MPARKVSIVAPVNPDKAQHSLLVGIPTLGTVRIEWHNAMGSMVIPTNFAVSHQTPIGYLVADAQNIICREAISKGFDWVLFIEDDVIVPADLYTRLRPYVECAEFPVVAGLYHLKTMPPEPMIYRGRGNGPYLKWKLGDVVACDGLPTGCTLIHTKLLRAVHAHRRSTRQVRLGTERLDVPEIFVTPREVWTDPALGTFKKSVGTSDLHFCDYAIEHKLVAKAGWPRLAKERYPFRVDTRIACGHVDRASGQIF